MVLSLLDWIFIIVSILIILHSTVRGFIHDFFAIASFLIGTAGAFLFFHNLSPFVMRTFSVPLWASNFIAFFALFIALFLTIKCIQLIINMLFSHSVLRSLDHALGFFLGIFESALVITIILFILKIQPFIAPDRLFAGSMIASLFFPVTDAAAQALPVLL
ncbi:MAG: CvpA family protein [Treponema sp.]